MPAATASRPVLRADNSNRPMIALMTHPAATIVEASPGVER
jgi:hypothetical protein